MDGNPLALNAETAPGLGLARLACGFSWPALRASPGRKPWVSGYWVSGILGFRVPVTYDRLSETETSLNGNKSGRKQAVGTILIIDNDPVFSAVLEDRLQVAGHEVDILTDREQMVDSVVNNPLDLVIYEVAEPGDAGLNLVRILRQRPETRTLPILVLSTSVESSDRVGALRAGADDYLTRPCDLEELMLRTERLVEGRTARQPVLQGDLSSHPLWELVQFLQQAGQSGSLVLRGALGNGRIQLAKGQLVDAHWEELPPREALLAIFGLKQGTFRFAAEPPGETTGAVLPTHEILMEAAWLEDELEKRRDFQPVSGTPLSVGDQDPSTVGGDFEADSLPMNEIRARIGEKPGTRLFDLLKDLPWAPQKIRLGVAWMIENDAVVVPSGAGANAYPNTIEITSTRLTEMAVTELLASARAAGFGTSALPFLILYEFGNETDVLNMLENVPGFSRNEALRDLQQQVMDSAAGSASFPADLGKMTLYVKALDAATQDEIEAVLTVSAGVFLWLDEGSDTDFIQALIDKLDSLCNAASGVVVATRPGTVEVARRLTEGKRCWQVSSHAPQSLLGVFRLLQPRAQ